MQILTYMFICFVIDAIAGIAFSSVGYYTLRHGYDRDECEKLFKIANIILLAGIIDSILIIIGCVFFSITT